MRIETVWRLERLVERFLVAVFLLAIVAALASIIDKLGAEEPPCPPSALAIIREKCVKCHGGEKPPNGLRLDSVDNMVRGGKHGPALVPFKPDESLMYKALTGADNAVRMPPFYPLEEDEVATIRRWIYRGAMQSTMGRCSP